MDVAFGGVICGGSYASQTVQKLIRTREESNEIVFLFVPFVSSSLAPLVTPISFNMDAPNIPPLPVQILQDDFSFLSHFRFTLEEIAWMAEHLGLPEVIISPSGRERVSRFEGLCIVLHRLAWPNRLKESKILFDMPLSSLSTL